jgi:signal transduction histidine kinase
VLKRDNETFYGLVREKTDELIASQMELGKAKRLSDIGSLAAVVAHELRNPLAAIGVVTYNIKRKASDPYVTKNIESIQKKIGESVQIINNLLYYSRLKPPHYQDVNIYDLLEESMGTLVDIHEKKALIQKKYKSLSRVMIEADQTQIKEVFYNILNNAYDAIPQKEGKINITAKNTGKTVEIFFRNNGSFIEKESLEKVFDPFFTTKAKGTGLGLTVCKQIINYHNGNITVESDAERGTLFKIVLPKKRKIFLNNLDNI